MKFRIYLLSLMACLLSSARMMADVTPITSVPFNKTNLTKGQYRILAGANRLKNAYSLC